MSFTRRLKYSNIVMQRNIRKNATTLAVGLMQARAETWTMLGLGVIVAYSITVALNTL